MLAAFFTGSFIPKRARKEGLHGCLGRLNTVVVNESLRGGRMNRYLLAVLLCTGVTGLLVARTAGAATQKDAPGALSQRYDALVKEYESARAKYFKEYGEAKTDEERQKLRYPQADTYAPRFLQLAQESPKDSAALDPLVWIATNCRSGATKERKTSLELLLKEHAKSPQLKKVAQSLIYSERETTEPWLRALLKEATDKEVKGWGTYALGRVLRAEDGSGNRNLSEAEKLFEDVASNYGDVKGYGQSLADAAKGELFEMRHLGIGQVAPDIQGEDLDGKKFKLSDYRGKVVVIDFWGDW